MKRFLIILFGSLMFLSCSNKSSEEQAITNTVNKFYKALEERDYKELSNCCTPNMQQMILKMKDNDFVGYKTFKIIDISIYANESVAQVKALDEFSNTLILSWNLIKQDNIWKMNNYNSTRTQNINSFFDTNTSFDVFDTIKVEDTVLHNDTIKKDTLHN